MSRGPAFDLPTVASLQRGEPLRCVEILGGNVLRTEGLILGGLEVLLVARPAGASGGGDIYCIHSCGHGALTKFVLLDLTGHGRERDAIARTIHDLLHRYTDETRPARLLERLNRQYSQLELPAVLATAVSAVYEPSRGEFRFANAGQPRPLHWSAEHGRWALVQPAEQSDCGLPLGVRATACYTEESIVLGAGDMLFLSSDGLPEMRGPLDEFLEPEGVFKFLEESTAENVPNSSLLKPAAAFLRRVQKFRAGTESQDDITLLWLRRLHADAGEGQSNPNHSQFEGASR